MENDTVQYALLAYENLEDTAQRTPEEHSALLGGYGQVAQALEAAGKLVFGDAVKPATTATSLRSTAPLFTDGPISEGREHLIGIFVIEADDLDEAIKWAQQMPHAQGAGGVEIRPIGA